MFSRSPSRLGLNRCYFHPRPSRPNRINHRSRGGGSPFEFSTLLISLYRGSYSLHVLGGTEICYVKTINVPKGRRERHHAVNKITFCAHRPIPLISLPEKQKTICSVFHYYLNTNWFFLFCGCSKRQQVGKGKVKKK
jgi:hypothetical protein